MSLLDYVKKTAGAFLLASPLLSANPSSSLEALVQEKTPQEIDLQTKNDAINRINWERRLVGLNDVSLDEELSKNATLHAEYLTRNLTIKEVNDNGIIRFEYSLDAHKENIDLPGYTLIGAKLAPGAEIYFGDPRCAVDSFIGSFYHRIPFIAPGINYAGIGISSGGNWDGGNATVIIFKADNNTIRPPNNRTIVYPADNQTDVPTRFGLNEHPNPIPKEDADGIAGFPVTVSFPSFAKIEDYSVSLRKANREVKGYLVTLLPNNPSNIDNHLCFIPQDPLEPNTTYTVEANANVNKTPWNQTWNFRTRKR